MRAFLKPMILTMAVTYAAAVNFTSDDFDETSHHINHDSISTAYSDSEEPKDEVQKIPQEEFSKSITPPPPVPTAPKLVFTEIASILKKNSKSQRSRMPWPSSHHRLLHLPPA